MIRRVLRGLERSAKKGRRAQRGWHISKRGNKGFYKGWGARSLGKTNSKGHFRYDPKKLPVLVVPDLTNCELKPYVSYGTPKIKVPPPRLEDLELHLSKTEVDILDIVAPQHKKYRQQKKAKQVDSTTTPPPPPSESPTSIPPEPPKLPPQYDRVDVNVIYQ